MPWKHEHPRLPKPPAWHWSIALLGLLAMLLAPQHAEPNSLRRHASGPIRPSPKQAGQDVPAPLHEGCMIGKEGTESGACLYGDPHGKRTLILFGDSHALQHFPALQAVAKRNRWRLLVLTKRECTPAEATIHSSVVEGAYSTCDTWRENSLKRIEATGGRAVVALSSLTSYRAFGSTGEELSGAANAEALEAGYGATLRRIKHAGLGAVVIRDTPQAPTDVPSCVAANIGDPAACDFPQPRSWDRNFDLRAAKEVPGTRLINVWAKICSHDVCHAVINRILVYRDDAHITATFSSTLGGFFEPTLKAAFGRRR